MCFPISFSESRIVSLEEMLCIMTEKNMCNFIPFIQTIRLATFKTNLSFFTG